MSISYPSLRCLAKGKRTNVKCCINLFGTLPLIHYHKVPRLLCAGSFLARSVHQSLYGVVLSLLRKNVTYTGVLVPTRNRKSTEKAQLWLTPPVVGSLDANTDKSEQNSGSQGGLHTKG